ncbi:PREDICTED: uncharacterized protein LOC105359663 [Ceratosolen solmsi marchali]|uniref:Transcription initiation factor TFIID subunit 6 n=1 Tax=Ceratosolen solmsi marchali TaxID=326594 RepID=A0AAJ6YBR4_9HYME|nr:PREDICTED: uncharacterized protein LOC105359663 [Ceratosolen solmsi marchali]XP_011494611.1 PREDICTED: uncharacterized protein LOC105359663 [Ceratosolen solmsi marchali]
MKEVLSTQTSSSYSNHFVNNNGESNSNNNVSYGSNATRKYAVLSTEWISAIGEELGMHPLPDTLLRKLAEDASYRLREVLHKCVTRLRHSKRKRLTSTDVNAVVTNLCDVDPLIGAPEQLPEYLSEAGLFVPHERFIDLSQKVNEPQSFSQVSVPFLQEVEIVDSKLLEARNNYAKRALKMLFNGSQKTFQVLLNDCATNACLGGEGVVDKLMSIARSMVISNNAQYTRVSTRTCQLIIAITNNNKAVYPYHLNSVDKLTELLLELLLGQGFINPNLETLFKDCALKLMLRWPSVANRFIPMLKSVLIRKDEQSFELKKKAIALELLAGVQPLIFLEKEIDSSLSLVNVLKYATPGSNMWHKIALIVCAFVKSGNQPLNYSVIIQHFGDSILPYLINDVAAIKNNKITNLPIIVRSKIKYASIRPSIAGKFGDRQIVFPDSTLRGPRQEIKFAFAGGRPVPSNNLRRVSLRANYQILRNESRAPYALVASRRLLIFKHKKKRLSGAYNLSKIIL